MFADLMNFDNFRRNNWEFEEKIETNLATAGQAVLGKACLTQNTVGHTVPIRYTRLYTG